MSLVFQEQRLYRRSWGRRRALLTFCVGAMVVTAITIVLVALDVVPGGKAATVCLSLEFVGNWIPFIALIDNPGEKRTWLEKFSSFCWIWLWLGAFIETFWEGTYVIVERLGIIQGATEADKYLWYWWAYAGKDTRYLENPADSTVFSLEVMAGICGPILFYTLWRQFKGHYMFANWSSLCLLLVLAWADFPFIIAEWHQGFDSIEGGFFGFWIVFIGMNLPWAVAPIPIIWGKYLEIRYWTERATFIQMRDAGLDVEILLASDGLPTPKAEIPPPPRDLRAAAALTP